MLAFLCFIKIIAEKSKLVWWFAKFSLPLSSIIFKLSTMYNLLNKIFQK